MSPATRSQSPEFCAQESRKVILPHEPSALGSPAEPPKRQRWGKSKNNKRQQTHIKYKPSRLIQLTKLTR